MAIGFMWCLIITCGQIYDEPKQIVGMGLLGLGFMMLTKMKPSEKHN